MRPAQRLRLWHVLWSVGIALSLLTIPALLGLFAGRELELLRPGVPWRLVFVAIAVAVGGWLAWRVVAGARASRSP